MRYIGSKKNLIEKFLEKIIKPHLTDKTTFADLFAGTGIVGKHFSNLSKYVISNDVEYYSFVISKALLCCSYSEKLKTNIEILNNLSLVKGFVFKKYSEGGKDKRKFFTKENAQKIDAIRQQIETWFSKKKINQNEYYFLIASLLEAVSKVANTTGVFGAYLKTFHSNSIKKLVILPIHKETIITNSDKHLVFNKDIIELISTRSFDIVYLDPPYNTRQYGANYGPLNYIALYDKKKEIYGKSGLVKDYYKSDFCKKQKVKESFILLLNKIKAQHIFISYNEEGLLNKEDAKKIFLTKGSVCLYKMKYKRYLSQKGKSKKQIDEYLYHIDCTKDTKEFIVKEIE